jgi:hypothetical protein
MKRWDITTELEVYHERLEMHKAQVEAQYQQQMAQIRATKSRIRGSSCSGSREGGKSKSTSTW